MEHKIRWTSGGRSHRQNRTAMERTAIERAQCSRALTALFVRGSVLAWRRTICISGSDRPFGHGEIQPVGRKRAEPLPQLR
jgi:hypothetical protein